ARPQPGGVEAPAHRELGQLPGREGDRALAVLAPAEPLLLRGSDDLAVDDEGSRRVVIDRIDAENSHKSQILRDWVKVGQPVRGQPWRASALLAPRTASRTSGAVPARPAPPTCKETA